ncbi:MAG: rRNA maturation RNase YbeY [Pseudomonadota bacterium]
MSVTVDIQCASQEPVPEEEDLRRWVCAALCGRTAPDKPEPEVSLRLVDRDEMVRHNQTYRGASGATNVLSFPAQLPEELNLPLLGDIIICAPIVREQAAAQHKSLDAHWAHMVVHGTLHLLGYDHTQEGDANAMEALETAILAKLDFPCPYQPQTLAEISPA